MSLGAKGHLLYLEFFLIRYLFLASFSLRQFYPTLSYTHSPLKPFVTSLSNLILGYSTGEDECLVHNGSLSNHNNLRRQLVKQGKSFDSFNDTEVAAGYISNNLSKNKSLDKTLKNCLKDLDGFYTFIAGTNKGFAVLRDEIACKPAVIAENSDYKRRH